MEQLRESRPFRPPDERSDPVCLAGGARAAAAFLEASTESKPVYISS
jgi:hypothetical protein